MQLAADRPQALPAITEAHFTAAAGAGSAAKALHRLGENAENTGEMQHLAEMAEECEYTRQESNLQPMAP
jgi:hypothetical protein